MKVTYAKHAAHYANIVGGHDLETFTFASPKNVRHPDLPPEAEYHSGFVEAGVQFWNYVRKHPLSPGTCERCPKRLQSEIR